MKSTREDLRIVTLFKNQGKAIIIRKPMFWTDSTFLQFERDSNGAQVGPAYVKTEPMYNKTGDFPFDMYRTAVI